MIAKMINISVLLAFTSLIFPIALTWLKLMSPVLDQPILLGISTLGLPICWATSVAGAIDRAGWKRARWLLLLAPGGAAWPLAAVRVMAVCLIGRECI